MVEDGSDGEFHASRKIIVQNWSVRFPTASFSCTHIPSACIFDVGTLSLLI